MYKWIALLLPPLLLGRWPEFITSVYTDGVGDGGDVKRVKVANERFIAE